MTNRQRRRQVRRLRPGSYDPLVHNRGVAYRKAALRNAAAWRRVGLAANRATKALISFGNALAEFGAATTAHTPGEQA